MPERQHNQEVINSVNQNKDVDDGNTVMDYMQQERERGITIRTAAISFNWKNY